MKELWIITVLIAAAAEGNTRVFISQNKTSWRAANSTCTVATPDVTYSELGYSVDVNLSNVNVVKFSTQMWTGYALAYYIFSYLGCVREQDVNTSHVANFTTRLDPGACFSACGKQGIIGIREDKTLKKLGAACYCFPNFSMSMVNNTYVNCNATCANPSNTACGAAGFLSLYSTAKSISVDKVKNLGPWEGSHHCIAYDPENATFYWQRCHMMHYVTCDDGGQMEHYDIMTWRQAAVRCFQDHTYPLSDVNATSLTHIPKQHSVTTTTLTWTNMFRCLVLSTRYDKVSHLEYGSLMKGDDTAYLEFSSINKSTIALCQEGTDISAHTSSKDTDSEDTDISAAPTSTISVLMTESTEMTSSSTGNRLRVDGQGYTEKEQPDYKYVIPAVVGAIIVAIMIVVGVILIRKRRAKLKESETSRPAVEYKNHDSLTPHPTTSDEAHTLKTDGDIQLDNKHIDDQLHSDYDVVDDDIGLKIELKRKTTEERKDELKHDPSLPAADAMEGSATRVHNDAIPNEGTTRNDSISVMNSQLLMAQDDTYDHTNYNGKAMTVPNQQSSTDNVYASTTKMYGRGQEEDSDETYDRTDSIRKVNRVADDSYDRLENVRKALENTDQALENTDQASKNTEQTLDNTEQASKNTEQALDNTEQASKNTKQTLASNDGIVDATLDAPITNFSHTNEENVTGESGAISGSNLAHCSDTKEESVTFGAGSMQTLAVNVDNVDMSGSAEHIYIEM